MMAVAQDRCPVAIKVTGLFLFYERRSSMIQILKDFETKSGDRKVHFSMTGRKEKVIA